MAIYRCETLNISRGGNPLGRSVVACAAYRAGERLRDDRYDTFHDYKNRSKDVAHSEILAPDNAPAFASDRAALWNAVESSEKRKDARLGRELLIALPYELMPDERRELIVGFARDELVSRGMIVDLSIHAPKTGLNHHAHLLMTTRTIDGDGFGLKERSWNDKEMLEEWRLAWETHCNNALEKAGLDVRVSRLSLEERGIEATPEPKKGPQVVALEQDGIETERGNLVRETRCDNQMLAAICDVATQGEITEYPAFTQGGTWIDRLWNSIEDGFDFVMKKAANLLRDVSSGGSWVERENQRRDAREMEMG